MYLKLQPTEQAGRWDWDGWEGTARFGDVPCWSWWLGRAVGCGDATSSRLEVPCSHLQ